jgi:hypothetical protein
MPPRQTPKQSLELLPFRPIDHVIGIQPERVIAGRVLQRRAPCRREVIDPRELKDTRPELDGNLLRPIRAPRIDHADLIKQPRHRRQGAWQVFLLDLHDHGQRGSGLVRMNLFNH